MRNHYIILAITMAFAASPARAIDEAAVNKAIAAGRKALLEAITDIAEIDYRTPQSPRTITIRGRVENDRGGKLTVVTLDGKRLVIAKRDIVHWIRAGHVHPEERGNYFGGPTTLAALALLLADVPTTDQTLSMALDALAADDTHEAGTYVHSLRATLWSTVLERPISKTHRVRYGKLLRDDVAWLQRAMHADGGWDYGLKGEELDRNDNSNTQFANLGLWAGSVAGVEVAPKTWKTIERHWLDSQHKDGAWDYGPVDIPTPSMTAAGCNSLFIVLDRAYARADSAYVLFEGARPHKTARDAMHRLYAAIEAGDSYLERVRPNIRSFMGYELFGLERLGVASGRAKIGGVDWFREYAGPVAAHEWGSDPIGDSFSLIFLVHGRAPVLMQKLEHGGGPDDWDYYHRDLFQLSRYLTRTFERIVRWQRIPVDASLTELQDAPILYIAGRSELSLPKETQERIRSYIDAGGIVFLHADLANQKFASSAMHLFEQMFDTEGFKFAALPVDHPVFGCRFGGPDSPWKRQVPLRGLSDGSRVLVFLCPVDIAGAWHQGRSDKFEEVYRIMANVRTYAAAPYAELPSRLRPSEEPAHFAETWQTLRLARLRHDGVWNLHAQAWPRFATQLRGEVGLRLETADAIKTGDDIPTDVDVLYVSAGSAIKMDAKARGALERYARAGGLILIDASDGREDGPGHVRMLLDALNFGTRGVLDATHPIVTGKFRGGRPLRDLTPTTEGVSLTRGGAVPPIITVSVDGRVAVLACPFDLIAGLDGPFIWNRVGYRNEDTRRIVGNILAWRAEQRHGADGVK